MSDIVERLRTEAGRDDLAYRTVTILMDAANVIEVLQKEAQRTCDHFGRTHHTGGWTCPACWATGPADATTRT